MTNITTEVAHILSSDVAVQSCLSRKIVNIRALAKYIIEKHDMQASTDAVISAIRRFDAACEIQEHKIKLSEIFSGAKLSTITSLSAIDISGRKSIQGVLDNFNSIADLDKGETLRLIKGNAHLRIIIDNKNLESFKESIVFSDFDNINNLVELTLETPTDNNLKITKGVIARIANELAARNINISEFIFTPSSVHIYVDSKDYLKAHSALHSIIKLK